MFRIPELGLTVIASNAGISLSTLVNGVFRHELKVESWIVAERKKAMVVNEDV